MDGVTIGIVLAFLLNLGTLTKLGIVIADAVSVTFFQKQFPANVPKNNVPGAKRQRNSLVDTVRAVEQLALARSVS